MVGWYHEGVGWGGWILMTVAMVAFWALVVFAIVTFSRSTQGSGGPPAAAGRDPVQILDDRLARGEIDETEYHARIKALRSSVH
jgi:putative membrane protein